MVIRLSPTLQKRVEREAKAKRTKPAKIIEVALKEHWRAQRKPREQVSEARKRLRELLKNQKPPDDFMAAVHRARRYARRLEEDNAEWIDSIMNKIATATSASNQ